METHDPGHYYSLTTYLPEKDWPNLNNHHAHLMFFKKIGERFPGNTGESYAGTNCQEVLRVLIDRCRYLYNQIPCVETKRIIEHLRMALLQFEIRAAREKGVQFPPSLLLRPIEELEACKVCGHVFPHKHDG